MCKMFKWIQCCCRQWPFSPNGLKKTRGGHWQYVTHITAITAHRQHSLQNITYLIFLLLEFDEYFSVSCGTRFMLLKTPIPAAYVPSRPSVLLLRTCFTRFCKHVIPKIYWKYPISIWCWPAVFDVCQTSNQHLFIGMMRDFLYSVNFHEVSPFML